MTPTSLAGQTALITRVNKGIGKAICFALAKEGANIVIAARNKSESRKTLDRLRTWEAKHLWFRLTCVAKKM